MKSAPNEHRNMSLYNDIDNKSLHFREVVIPVQVTYKSQCQFKKL